METGRRALLVAFIKELLPKKKHNLPGEVVSSV
jgi:hypothetical protein